MNEYWSPSFHADVAADFADAKLEWVGTAQLLENFRELMLTEEQRAIHDRFDDPVMRELVKDMAVSRGFRHDVFVRGARRLGRAARDAALGDVVLAPLVSPDSFAFEMDLPAGHASFGQAFHAPIAAALTDRPRSIAELLALPDIEGNRNNPAELAGMLVGTEQALPVVLGRDQDAQRSATFNDLAARSISQCGPLDRGMAFASAELGNGVPCQALDLLVYGRLRACRGEPEPMRWAAELTDDRDSDQASGLAEILGKIVSQRLPVWRTLRLL